MVKRILVNTFLFLVLAYIIPGMTVTGIGGALIAAIVYAVLTAIVKPILEMIALPVNFLTLGLVNFLIGGLILYMASGLSGLNFTSYWSALLASVGLAVLQGIILPNKPERR